MDGNDTVIGRQPENNSAFKDGDQLIEISTFSQTQLTQAVEKAREPLLEKVFNFLKLNFKHIIYLLIYLFQIKTPCLIKSSIAKVF